MKRKHIFPAVGTAAAALAAVLLASSSVGSADAYFTTYAEAAGGRSLSVGSQPGIEEEFSSWTKTVTVSNSENSQPVYVRVRAFGGSSYGLVYQDDSGKWSAGGDEFYYYSDIVNPGEGTLPIKVGISGIPEGEGSFNVAVVYEATPVQYDAGGMPYADWDLKVEVLGTAGE